MVFFLKPNLRPPGDWYWTHLGSGVKVTGNSYEDLMAMARQFLRTNNFPIPPDFEQVVAAQICDRLPDFCGKTEPPTLEDMAREFSRAALGWVKGGIKLVSPEVYFARLKECKECPLFSGMAGIGFARCGKCGCTRLKLYVADQQCPLPTPRWNKEA